MRLIKIKADTYRQDYNYRECMQNDDIKLEITLLESGLPYPLAGCTVVLNWVKADNTLVAIDSDKITINNNIITAELIRDCSRAVGTAKFELTITDSNSKQISTFPLSLDIVSSTIQGQAVSQNVATIIENLNEANATAVATKTALDISIANGDTAQMRSELDAHASSLADNAISPEKFEGTDAQKVQQALDYALTNNVGIKFAKMYDITGSTLMINRPQNYYGTDRKQLYLIGVGGGLKKTDSGFIFDATYINTGDININSLKYESTAGVGTKVWNGDKIIRTKSINCQYRNVDTIVSAPTRYTQSIYFINEQITGGNGWKFEALEYLDTTIQNCLVEDIEHFVCNTIGRPSIQNTKLRILNNVVENLRGTTLKLGATYNCDIVGNHMEVNNAYFDLITLNQLYHYALNIEDNHFNLIQAQKDANVPCIRLGNTQAGASYGQGGSRSSCNTSNGILYSIEFTEPNSFITSIGDVGTITGITTRFIQLSKPFTKTYANGTVLTQYGFTSQLRNSKSFTLNAGATNAFTIPMDGLVDQADVYSINFSNAFNVQLLSVQVVSGDLYFWVKNLDTSNPITRTAYGSAFRAGVINS